MMEKLTKTDDLNSWKLNDSGQTPRKLTWDQHRHSESVWQLYGLVYLWGSEQWNGGLSLALELAFGKLFPILDCLSQP